MRTHGLTRPRFQADETLNARNLRCEQDYRRQRLRRHRRHLHGWGVICGLGVVPANDPARPWSVRICPGYALGPWGDEIQVPAPARLDVREDLWRLPTGLPPVIAWVGLRYAEELVQPMAVDRRGCGGCEPSEEPSRLRDGFHLETLWELPVLGEVSGVDLCRPGPIPCQECPKSPHVILARLSLPASEGDPITVARIENEVNRD